MSHFDRRCFLTSLAGGAVITSVRGVTLALTRPEETWRYGTWPNVSAEEWEIEKALLRGDYIEVASAR